MSKAKELHDVGQSVWLDFIRRELLESGELARLVDGGLRGETSNPTIFQKAIGDSNEYDDDIAAILQEDPAADATTVLERLMVADIQAATDILRGVYDSSDGGDGFVSLEVSPLLAADTEGTIAEARRLWKLVDRPNLMIKVPATPEGIPAITTLLADGVNVNVTLMFSLDHYEAVAEAYIKGLEQAADPTGLASVASFFVSRVDTKVDKALAEIDHPAARALEGKIAVANSKATYQRYLQIFEGDRFAELAARGAKPQRVLWASTSTKNPNYRDVLYVEELIGRNTVNTLPPATLEAFDDHGEIKADAIESDVADAYVQLAALGGLGVDLDVLTEELQVEGVDAFAKSFEDLLAVVADKVASIRG